MAVTSKELSSGITTPYRDAIENKGINDALLARLIWSELHAKTPEVIKFDGTISPDAKLPKGWKLIISSGGKSLLEVHRVDMATRQRARMDVQKIRDNYPSERLDVTHFGVKEILDALDGRSTSLPSKRKPNVSGA